MTGRLAAGLSWVDLQFLGRPRAIATAVIAGAGELALVDPGPTPCLATLDLGLQSLGLRFADVTHILLTHIHLDHAACTGTIVRRHPRVKVFVHSRGARHLVDPAKLLASATMLYGDRMDELWGDVLPVPAAQLVVLEGGERITAGGRRFEVAYTPGHAVHHVSYFDQSSGVAFVGDTAGVQIDGGYLLPPTPPPDIDLDTWRASASRIEHWDPQTLFLTHFGPSLGSARAHLQTMLAHLQTLAEFVRVSLSEPGSDQERAGRFAEQVRREFRREMSEAQLASYGVAAPFELLWLGLARYWRKRGADA
jgi:glyoxylase-like metal-dependent hydrolase (beta-lactamase superfamily II)